MGFGSGAARNLRFSWVLIALALAYAFLAGFHTTDFDTGWTLASGRYILQHHSIPTTEQFSYTARGTEWIYPPLSEVIFYLLYLLGGYKALSWLTAVACAGTVALLLRRDEPITAGLAILAVPAIAFRTVARADLFTTLCFAALLRVLWTQFRSGRARLWWIPLILVLWTNLHFGFAAGLGLLVAYAGMEVLQAFVARFSVLVSRHSPPSATNNEERVTSNAQRATSNEPLSRLRRAAPWLAAGFAATLLNPWGPGIYRGLFEEPLFSHAWNYISGEFMATPAASAWGALDWRDPQGAYWWLLVVAAAGIVVALSRRQLGPAVLLAGTAYASLSRVRYQGMLAIVVVVAAGAMLSDAARAEMERTEETKRRTWTVVALAATCLLAAFTGVRCADLVSNRYYIRAAEASLFGAGPAWGYPERAANFVLREHLPGRMLNSYNIGSYLLWKLPDYDVYSDNRAIPFGTSLLFHQRWLMEQPPDAEAWDQEVAKWGINFLFLSTSRYGGLDFALPDFCTSRKWTPVYLDDVAAVFLRNRPENAELAQRLRIDCATARFTPPAGGKAEQFQFYADAGAILYLLSRDQEALAALNQAQQLFPDDAGVHLSRGQLFQAEGHLPEAEREYRAALLLKETSVGWHMLGLLLASQKRWPQAAAALQNAARLDVYPQEMYVQLGEVYLGEYQADPALAAFAKARASSPFRGDAAQFGTEFLAQVADGEARAWRIRGDLPQAISREEDAVRLTPNSAPRWLELAAFYDAAGRAQDAQQARDRAQALQSAAR